MAAAPAHPVGSNPNPSTALVRWAPRQRCPAQLLSVLPGAYDTEYMPQTTYPPCPGTGGARPTPRGAPFCRHRHTRGCGPLGPRGLGRALPPRPEKKTLTNGSGVVAGLFLALHRDARGNILMVAHSPLAGGCGYHARDIGWGESRIPDPRRLLVPPPPRVPLRGDRTEWGPRLVNNARGVI